MNRGSTELHCKCSVVNRESTGVLPDRGYTGVTSARWERNLFFMKCVPVHHGIPAVLHRDVLWLHLHSENGALVPVQPRKTRPYITENLLMGRNESNQTSTSCAYLRLKLTATSLEWYSGMEWYNGRYYFTINLHESMRPGCDQLRTPGSSVRHASVARHVTDCLRGPIWRFVPAATFVSAIFCASRKFCASRNFCASSIFWAGSNFLS